MSDTDINNLNCKDDPACNSIEEILKEKNIAIKEILKEKRIAIEEIRAEMDLAIDEILLESEDSNEGQVVNGMAEAVKKQRKKGRRDCDRRARDADYDSHERRHSEGQKK